MTSELTDLCATIGKVMGNVLRRDPLGAGEDFFACGGDSMQAAIVLRSLLDEHGLAGSEELESELFVGIFDDATPGALASIVVAHTDDHGSGSAADARRAAA